MGKIALTGAEGMIGRHMVALMIQEKIEFKSITRACWDLVEWKSFEELDVIFGDVDAVFHFGAALPKNLSTQENLETQIIFDVNVRSSLNLSEWALSRNKVVVFLSGSTVYQDVNMLNIPEDAPKVINGFGGFYGYSKLLAENAFNHYIAKGLKAIILRPTSVYGYGLGESKLIANYLNLASKGMTINISGPYNKINFIHAYDVSRAAFESYNKKSFGTYNIGAEESVSIEFLANTCVSVCRSGDVKISTEEMSRNEEPYTRFDLDCSKAKNDFLFKNVLNLKAGLELMATKRMLPC